MAFNNGGNSYNNGGNSGYDYYAPETLSSYGYKNPKSDLASELFIGGWRNTMVVGIAALETKQKPDDDDTYDRKNAVKIYLNPAKAAIFYRELEAFKAGEKSTAGVTNQKGNSQIFIAKGSVFGVNNDCIVIRTFDNDGKEIKSAAYEFNSDNGTYFGISDIDIESANVSFDYYDDIEKEAFINTVKDYSLCHGQAIAAATNDAIAFKLDYIYRGVKQINGDNNNGGNNRSSNSGSYFRNRAVAGNQDNNQQPTNKGNLEDMMG